jgi:methyl-accepting chemotaxis protein WspA
MRDETQTRSSLTLGGVQMKNWSVKQRIILGFSAVILIMIALMVVSWTHLNEIKGQAVSITSDTWPGVYLSSQIESFSRATFASFEKYVLATNGEEKRQIEAEIDSNRTKIDGLMKQYDLTISRDDDRRMFASLTSARATCEAAFKPVMQLNEKTTSNEGQTLLREQVNPACVEFTKWASTEVDDNKQVGDDSNKRILDAVSRAQLAIPIGSLIGILLALISGYVLVQAINRPLAKLVSAVEVMRTGNFSQKLKLDRQDEFGILADGLNLMTSDLTALIGKVQKSGLQVNTSSTEIAATSQEQLSTANEIAATTSEIGATSKQISVTSKELVHTMKEVADVAEKTTALASSGQAGLKRMKTTVQQIMEASTSINDRLAVLSDKAGNIGTVVTTITKVADQTNLLSLNAAIEAEKAGEYGRGFAVVATEIRRLADQTAVSTSDIEQTVKEMQSAVAAGVMGMDKFSEEVRKGVDVVQQVSEELSQIIQQVQTLTPSFEAVSEGMQSQSLGAQQISDSLSQLSEAAKQTVDSMRQSNLAIDQLNDAARGLQNGVSRFTLEA